MQSATADELAMCEPSNKELHHIRNHRIKSGGKNEMTELRKYFDCGSN